jgi:hypothetical protein
VEVVGRVGSLQLKILNMEYTKRILFKVSNRLYLKLKWVIQKSRYNVKSLAKILEGCEQASAIWRASKHPKKLTSEQASEQKG